MDQRDNRRKFDFEIKLNPKENKTESQRSNIKIDTFFLLKDGNIKIIFSSGRLPESLFQM